MSEKVIYCTKIAYISRGEATKKAHAAHLKATPYLCPICGQWHITSGIATVRGKIKKDTFKKTIKRGGRGK